MIEYLPIVIGSAISVTFCRSIRIFRHEEGMPRLKRWELRLVATIVGFMAVYTSELIFYDMSQPKALLLGLGTGLATPMVWKVVIAILESKYPTLKEKLHPKLDDIS